MGVAAPGPHITCPIRGSDEVLPLKAWNEVTEVSAVVTRWSPLDVVTTRVLESDPRLFDVTMVNVTGAPDVFVKMFIQRMKRSLFGTKTLRCTLNEPMVCAV